jgi:asparagine synthase (glutamine-hydrolysing)
MGAWLKAELSPLIETLLSRESISSRGLLRAEPIRRLIDDHRNNRVDGTDKLLALLNLEIWSRIFIDGASPDEVTAGLQRSAG